MCDCAQKIACCCCQCALSMILSAICGLLIIAVIIGVAVWYFAYHQKEDDPAGNVKKFFENAANDVSANFKNL